MADIPRPIDEGDFDIDWLRRLEGGQQLTGYIPRVNLKSGTTIASGIDLGQMEFVDELRRIVGPKDETLVAKLQPYIGLRGEDAQRFLFKNPLRLTPTEATKLDKYFMLHYGRKVAELYGRSLIPKRLKSVPYFVDLPFEAKTVALSVAWHCGYNLARNSPKFWGWFLSNDWKRCQVELWNFYGKRSVAKGFVNRRQLEAKRLLVLTGGKLYTEAPWKTNPLMKR